MQLDHSEALIGQTVSHYKVSERIGRGGMGVVYRAQDLSLGRHVALKFLPPEVAGDSLAVGRLRREARAAAAPNHPNICAIYEIGTHQGQPFIAMELVKGKTLDEAIGVASSGSESFGSDLPPDVAMVVRDFRTNEHRSPSSRPLPLEQVLDLAIQLADALDTAHREGVIHRDIKPSNVILTSRGQAKILDFGLAKQVTAVPGLDETRMDLSQEGSVSGTIIYMSPEQALGQKLDGRTDIFSLGAVLYEISTGRRAFGGDTPAAVFDAVLNKDPVAPSRINSEVPQEVDRIIGKTLSKDKDQRYLRARDLLDDLERFRSSGPVARELAPSVSAPAFPAWPVALSSMASVSRVPSERSIAVLPFVNMSSDKESEYLGDGLAEELINALTRVDGLRVASRTSAFQFRNRANDVESIGDALNVATLLEGSVRRSGKRVRINAQLINVSDGYHLWSERYDREMDDIFELQDDITRQIVDKLKIQLAGGAGNVGSRRPTADVEAYNLYLKGRYHLTQRSEQNLVSAIECFEASVEQDPEYSLPHSGLAEAYILLNIDCPQLFCERNAADMVARAVGAANQAIRLDDSSAEAHVALALVCYRLDWNWEEADRQFRIALDLDGNLAHAHHQYAMFLSSMNRLSEAVVEIRRAQDLDPVSPLISTAVTRVLQFAGRLDEAIEQAKHTLELNHEFSPAYFDLGLAYLEAESYPEALAAFKRLGELSGDPKRELMGQIWIHARKNEREEAVRSLKKLSRLAGERDLPTVPQAVVYADLGDLDTAFKLLNDGFENRDSNLVYLLCEAGFKPLHGDSRFDDLVRRMDLQRYR
jgi:serine/threonine protein kinase/Tfp pilus assembly protein PilF